MMGFLVGVLVGVLLGGLLEGRSKQKAMRGLAEEVLLLRAHVAFLRKQLP